jgi:ankyrin repeat protein
MFAIRYGHSVMVDKLLDKGANIEATNKVTY